MKNTILLMLTVIPLAGISQYSSAPPIIAYDNCELNPVWVWGGDRKKNWTYWTGGDHTLPGSATTAGMNRTANYVRSGNYSYKARITKDLTYISSNNTFRSEMMFSNPQQAPIGWRWAAVSVFLPEDFCIENAPVSIAFSTKASPDDYETPFRLDTRNGRYYAIRANITETGTVTGGVATDLGPIDRGKWVDWVYNRDFSQSASGYQRLYKNGVLVWSYTGPNWVTGAGRITEGYMPMGLYKWPWMSAGGEGWGPTACNDAIEVYYDEYRFGDAQATLQNFLIPTLPPLTAPFVFTPIENQVYIINAPDKLISLSSCFRDEKGISNLTYSLAGNTNTALVNATIIGSQLTTAIIPNQIGTATIKIRATDSDGKFVEDDFEITVQAPVLIAPTVANPVADQSAVINTPTKELSLANVFNDDKGTANLSYSVSANSNANLITQTTINGSTLLMTITPGETGSATIKLRATDSDGLFVEDEFNITVLPATPVGPTISSPVPDQSVIFNTTSKQISLANIFTDDEGPENISYSISENSNPALISNMSINGNTLTLSITPGQSGSSAIKIKATDSDGLFIEDEFVIDVEAAVPVAPVVPNPIQDRIVVFNVATELINLVNVFSDDEGVGNISYSVSGNSNPLLISATWIEGSTLSLTIAAGQSGNATIKVKATDSDGLFAEDEFQIFVESATPVAPQISNPVPNQTAGFNTPFKLISLANVFSDDEGANNIVLSVSDVSNTSLITNASINETMLTLSIATGQSGSSTIKIKATDNDGLFTEDEFDISVEAYIPQQPTIVNPIPNQSAGFNTATKQLSLANVFNDDRGSNNLFYTINGNSNPNLISNTLIEGTTLTLSITPGQSGSSTIKVKATDSDGLFVEDEFDILITAGVAPVVANPIPDQSAPYNSGNKLVNFSNTFTDDKGGANISYSITGNTNPALVTNAIIGGTNLTLTIGAAQAGTAAITVKATDSDGLFVEDQFTIVVSAGSPPIVANAIADQSAAFNTANKIVSLSNVFSDDKGTSNLSYTITGNSNTTLITNTTISGNNLTLTIGAAKSGTSTIKVKATDSDGLFVEDQFIITVAAGTPPVIANAIPDQSSVFNTANKVINISNVFSDDKGSTNLVYSISGNSNTTLITNTTISNNNLTLTIGSAKSGTSTIKVKATDSDGLFVEDQFVISVAGPAAPVITNPIPDQSSVFNSTSKVISLSGVFSDDKSVNSLTYTVSGNTNTTLITRTSISSNNLTLTIGAAKSGTSTIKVKATDGDGLFVEDQFVITVAAAAAPVIANAIPDQSAAYNTTTKLISLSNVFSDDRGLSNLTYSISGNTNTTLITKTAISSNNLTLTIGAAKSGTSTIKLRATDADGLFVEDQFVITVAAAPVKILINSGGQNFTYNGDAWVADKNYSGGSGYSVSSSTAIGGTQNDVLYRTERHGNFNYSIPVSNGKYNVILHFAELYHTAINKRKFNVNLENGQGVLSNYDIIAKAGGAKIARTEQFVINVTDGNLNIGFVTVLDNAMISGIEITTNTSARIMNANPAELNTQRETSETSSVVPDLSVATAYPNPFTERVQINLKLTRTSKVKMEILNSSGQLVLKYAEEIVNAGSFYRKEFFRKGNRPGAYIYRISTDAGELISGKIIMQ